MDHTHTVATRKSAKSRYERLKHDRQQFLDRARQCAELTIPTLIPPEGRSASTRYYTPWQGVGARGVNNLASKLLLSLLPPNAPFFRMSVDDDTKEKLAGDPKLKSGIDEGLGRYERIVQTDIEQSNLRNPTFITLKHLIVGGNTFNTMPQEGGMRVYPLDSFVVVRDCDGNLLEAITEEKVAKETLPDDIQELLAEDAPQLEKKLTADNKATKVDDIEIYTHYWLDGKRWRSCQEVEGKEVPGSHGSWPKDKPPFMALRWNHVEGEDYGRGYVEEYIGDLVSLEGLSKAIVEAAAASAKVIFLVKPNGVTKAKAITEAESGDAITGDRQDVETLQVEKQADLSVAERAIQSLTERLSYAFLLSSAVQRNGERVTAEEIRYMASELEDALGGVYSVLSQEFQLPLVHRIIDRLTRAKRLPDLPKGVAKPVIVTGLEALGRGHDAQRLGQTLTELRQALGDAVLQYIHPQEAISRLFTARLIDPVGLVKTPEDMQADQMKAQQAQMAQVQGDAMAKSAPAGIKGMVDLIKASGEQQAAPQG